MREVVGSFLRRCKFVYFDIFSFPITVCTISSDMKHHGFVSHIGDIFVRNISSDVRHHIFLCNIGSDL